MERRTLVYSLLLGVVVIALGVVLILVLRKRSVEGNLSEIRSTGSPFVSPKTKPTVRLLESYTPERPLQDGDPGFAPPGLDSGLVDPSQNATSSQ